MSIEKKISVLYIDDEVNNLDSFKAAFRRDFNVFTAISARDGLQLLEQNQIEIVLSDQRMPEMTGVEFFAQIKDKHPDCMRILITGFADIATVIDAINMGQVYRYVSKPWCNEDLKILIQQAYEVYKLRADNKKLTADLLLVNQQLEFVLRQKLSSL
jgi:response regulator RpfG family c-di-GMP phosphodiesterase